jgi:uncharacterized repeat protein (TIGR04052 family)
MKAPLVLCALSCGLLVACGDDGSADGSSTSDTEPSTTASTTDSTTASTTASTTDATTSTSDDSSSTAADTSTSDPTDGSESSTGGSDVDVTVQFQLRVGDQDASCDQSYDNVGASDATVSFRDLRFYVSNVRLLDAEGAETPIMLTQDGQWQYETVALLDFEDATGECGEGNTAATNAVVLGTVPAGDYTGIRFELGVPFELNHLDTGAPPPLDDTAMFWAWASGRKFLRIDMTNENDAPGNGWFVHLGSQGCVSDGMVDPPTEPCTRPALPTITLEGFDPTTNTIVGDIATLVADEDVNMDTPMSAPGCMSFSPDAAECDQLFPHLGLSWDSGACENDCAGQDFFSVE